MARRPIARLVLRRQNKGRPVRAPSLYCCPASPELEGDLAVHLKQALCDCRALERAVRAGRRSNSTGNLAERARANVARRLSEVDLVENVVRIGTDRERHPLANREFFQQA